MKICYRSFILMAAVSMAFAMPPKPGQRGPASCIVGPARAHAKNLRDYTIETVAILVQFADNRADTVDRRPVRFDSMFYSTDVYYGQYRAGSLNDYFLENSYNTCNVSGGIAGNRWQMSSHTYSYYYDGYYMLSTGYELASDAVALVDAAVDFSQYDLNNDGHIDGVFVVHAGPGGEDTGNINHCWSHAIPWFNYSTNDGVIIDGATNVPEINLVTASLDTTLCCIAVMCHELGHVIGLPDCYDGSRDTWGIGYWGLMGYGAWGAGGNTPWSPSHCEAWSKEEVNWLTITPITSNTFGLKILDLESHAVAYRVWRNGAINDTFFILENRQNKGFDAPLPGRGLLLWHIDPRYGSYDDILDIEEADGCDDLDHGFGYRPDPHYYWHELGDSGDPYPGDSGNVLFDYSSYPSSRDNNGTATNIIVRNIVLLGDTVQCDVLINTTGAEEQQVFDQLAGAAWMSVSPNPSSGQIVIKYVVSSPVGQGFSLAQKSKPEGLPYIKIFDSAGRRVKTLPLPTTYSILPTAVTWDGRDDLGAILPGGVYFIRAETGSGSVTGEAVLMR